MVLRDIVIWKYHLCRFVIVLSSFFHRVKNSFHSSINTTHPLSHILIKCELTLIGYKQLAVLRAKTVLRSKTFLCF